MEVDEGRSFDDTKNDNESEQRDPEGSCGEQELVVLPVVVAVVGSCKR